MLYTNAIYLCQVTKKYLLKSSIKIFYTVLSCEKKQSAIESMLSCVGSLVVCLYIYFCLVLEFLQKGNAYLR